MSGLGIGIPIVTAMYNQASQDRREQRSLSNQRALNEQQFGYQQQLNQQGADLSYQNWLKTNFSAQMREMDKAGLNKSLMYGMSGGGGTTAQTGSGGSAQSSSAPQPQQLDIASIMQTALLKSEAELKEAQKENIEADTEKKKGVDTEEATSRTNLNNIKTKLNEVEEKLKRKDLLWKDRERGAVINTLEQQLDIIQRENLVDERTMYDRIETIKNEAISSGIKIREQEANIKLTEEQRNRLWHQIRQDWVKAGLQGLDTIIKGRFKDIGSKMQKANEKGFKEGMDYSKRQYQRD